MTEMDSMGQTLSTPLDLILDHFGEVKMQADDLSVNVRKDRLTIFGRSEWPTFNVG